MPAADSPAAHQRQNRWVLRAPHNPALALVDRVLAARGLDDPASAAAFLDASLLHLHDPAALPGIPQATDRILAAIASKRPIVIYGDYDVDGITATAILYHTIRLLSPDAPLRTYVPHRLDEGYGLNTDALRELHAQGAALVISVDCGITATEQADIANRLGLELIITDHHNPRADGELPSAAALVHPALPGSAYPFPDLCGAGVAYKLAWNLAVRHADRPDNKASPEARTLLVELLAFASLGTIADMVPLTDENRILTRFGLGRVKHSPFEGLRALVDASGLGGERIEADDVGFRLGPRLNACGRMGHAADAVELFTTATGDRARRIADQLHQQNIKRQAAERKITEQAAAAAIEHNLLTDEHRAIVLRHPEWHPGVVGIVCSRLVERFARPVILLCDDGQRLKGSGRSIPGFNLHEALCDCQTHLDTFGGHDAAAGLSLASDRFEKFAAAFREAAAERLAPDDLVHTITADTEASPDELTPDAIRKLDKLKPCGRGNAKVRVIVRAAPLARPPETFGTNARHLSLILATRHGPPLRCIAWNQGAKRDSIQRGQTLDAVLTPEISSFSGRVEPIIQDWRPA